MKKSTTSKPAILTMVVTFETVPTPDAIERILDEAKSYGAVEKADLVLMQPATIDVRHGWS